MLVFNKNIYDPAVKWGFYYHYTNGDILSGVMANNQMVEQATCWYGNGDTYIGWYKDLKRDDEHGDYIYENNDYISGVFRNDNPTERTARGENYPSRPRRPYYRK
jgi:hypothetical protein